MKKYTCKDCFWIHQFPIEKQKYRCELKTKDKTIAKRYIVSLNDNICSFFESKNNQL